MNFLAHTYLSGSDENIILGNLIADAIKGKKFRNYNPGFQKGVILHREIDSYTDLHLVFNKSCKRLRSKNHLYAGVVVDIFYDHFLARYWNEYSNENFYSYVTRIYGIMLRNYAILPPKTKHILPFIVRDNWLYSYRNPEGLQRIFIAMAKRTGSASHMENVVDDLLSHYADFEAEFREFFNDIIIWNKGKSLTGFPPKNI